MNRAELFMFIFSVTCLITVIFNSFYLILTWKKNSIFNKYPCDAFLHNALKFIWDNQSAIAYDEICYAIKKSGGKLSTKEQARREVLKSKIGEQLKESKDDGKRNDCKSS